MRRKKKGAAPSRISLGFEINDTNKYGETPLFDCARLGRWEMVGLLLQHGADPEIRNHVGDTIFDALEESDQPEDAEHLRNMSRSIQT